MDEESFDMLLKTFKSLFDSNIDKYVYVNREWNLENSVCFEGMESDFHDENYDKLLNNLFVENINGLIVEKFESMKTWFIFQGEKVLMRQFINYRGDIIHFVFTKISQKLDC